MGQSLIQLPRPLGQAKREIDHGSEDAGSGAKEEADKQRRKIQNRRNQRAHRLRLKGKEGGAGQTPRPFKVARWRLDELEPDVRCPDKTSPPPEGASTTEAHLVSPQHAEGSSPSGVEDTCTLTPIESQLTAHNHVPPQAPDQNNNTSFTFTFPLSSDHLLHLIQYNVLRALLTNKRSLNLYIPPPAPGGDRHQTYIACPISGILYRGHNHYYEDITNPLHLDDADVPSITFPASLAPTALQKSHDHPIWVNAIPFPGVRDNFIRHAGRFNPWHLMYDLVGEFMSSTPPACVPGYPRPTALAAREAARVRGSGAAVSVGMAVAVDDDDDEVTAGRRGLIVWGEPHDARSWEFTPGFLARWAWAVEGCEAELVEISNRWRARRGEEPMRLEVVRRH